MTTPNLTDSSSQWQNQPTTNITEARAVAIVTAKFGVKTGAAFKKWYDQARKQDPGITPNQAAGAFLTGYSLSQGLGGAGAVLGGLPAAAAKGAENAVNALSPGGSSPACALHVPSFGPFGGWCIISKTALRGLAGGLVLGAAGAVAITGAVILAAYGLNNTKAGQAIRKSGEAVGKAAAIAGGG